MTPGNPADTQGHGGYGATGSPAGIAAGPDGAIVARHARAATVVRADAATMDELVVSDIDVTGFNIRNLSPGPDGNVWVTDFGGQDRAGHARRLS